MHCDLLLTLSTNMSCLATGWSHLAKYTFLDQRYYGVDIKLEYLEVTVLRREAGEVRIAAERAPAC
jgi:hypothetical protein